jgi:alcohol dehydrogenase (cytochrome c)
MGGKNWPPTAYNPDTKLWYIPVIESCNVVTVQETKPGTFKSREFWTGGGPSNPDRITGSVTAIDVTTGKVAGKLSLPYPMLGGILATPSVIFFGEPDGKFIAADAKTLKKLWEFDTGGGISAPPMAFTSGGKEYVAILVGQGGAWDKWFIDSTPDLKRIQPGSMLFVFGL